MNKDINNKYKLFLTATFVTACQNTQQQMDPSNRSVKQEPIAIPCKKIKQEQWDESNPYIIDATGSKDIKEAIDFVRKSGIAYVDYKSYDRAYIDIDKDDPILDLVAVDSLQSVTWLDATNNGDIKNINLDLSQISNDNQINLLLSKLSHRTRNEINVLDISDNINVTTIKLPHLPKLKRLYLYGNGNGVKHVDLTQVSSELKLLLLDGNEIDPIELPGLERLHNLRGLCLSSCMREEIDLSLFPQLKRLDLTYNKFTAIPKLSKDSSIKKLRLCSNNIRRIQWKDLPFSLDEIDLCENEITTLDDLDLNNFPYVLNKKITLYLHGNPICQNKNKIEETLKNLPFNQFIEIEWDCVSDIITFHYTLPI